MRKYDIRRGGEYELNLKWVVCFQDRWY